MLNTNNKNTQDASNLYQQHKQRLNGISSSRKLLDLMLEIQRHRAASLASLGGDIFFQNRLFNIQKMISQRLVELSRNSEQLITEQELHQLNGEWVTVRTQWQKDTVMQNFLLHSHLINLILRINRDICRRAGHDQIDANHHALANYCLSDLPRLIEAAAQARGLATHCAAQKTSADKIILKIKYLVDEIQQLDCKAQLTLVDTSVEHYRIIQQTHNASNSQGYKDTFIQQLNTHFTEHTQPELFPDEIYSSGSQFIMATYDVLLRAYKLMSKSMDDDMHEWIYRSSYHS